MEPSDNYTGCKVGDRIRLVAMPDDPDPLPIGATGTVVSLTDGPFGQIGVEWDNGRTLFLIPGVDKFEVVDDSNMVGEDSACPKCGNRDVDRLAWDEDDGEFVTCMVCGMVYGPGGEAYVPLTEPNDEHETEPASPDDKVDPT